MNAVRRYEGVADILTDVYALGKIEVVEISTTSASPVTRLVGGIEQRHAELE